MEETTIAAGDIVKLKSGGPAMTVEYLNGQDSAFAQCHYFPADGSELVTLLLAVILLIKTTPAS